MKRNIAPREITPPGDSCTTSCWQPWGAPPAPAARMGRLVRLTGIIDPVQPHDAGHSCWMLLLLGNHPFIRPDNPSSRGPGRTLPGFTRNWLVAEPAGAPTYLHACTATPRLRKGQPGGCTSSSQRRRGRCFGRTCRPCLRIRSSDKAGEGSDRCFRVMGPKACAYLS